MEEQLYKEQEKVINHNEGNIMVSASAGSGKTFSMIKRLVRLIAEGRADVKEILAVTFTEAAAKEMKEKLAKGISEEIAAGKTSLASQISDLPYADVCTIDSFCSRLVRLYFYKAGVSPDFSIADAAVAEKLKNEAVDKAFKKAYESNDENFLLLAKRFSTGRRDSALKDAVMQCYEFISTETDPEKFKRENLSLYSEESYAKIKEEYVSIVKNRLSLIADDLIKLGEKLSCAVYKEGSGYKIGLATLYALNQAVLSAVNSDLFGSLEALNAVTKGFERNPTEEGAKLKAALYVYVDKVKNVGEEAKEFLDGYNEDISRLPSLKSQTETFYSLIDGYEKEYSLLKAEENLLDFNDLERLAQKILLFSDVAAAVKEKYKYVFVDEYQDVNGIQEDIISALSNDNLFTVGDVKQSIYAFRGCRSDFFTQKFNLMKSSGESAEKLNRNFRSAKRVIDSVNEVFAFSMTKKRYGEDYNDGSRLIYGEKYADNVGRFSIYSVENDADDEPKEDCEVKPKLEVYDVLKAAKRVKEDKTAVVVTNEARLAAYVIKNELGKDFYDPDEKRMKKVGWSDIAILSRTGVEVSERFVKGLLSLGIPVTYDGETSVLDYPEIGVLYSLLKVIDNFYDDISLATVMKSPLFGFSDEDLVSIAVGYYNGEQKSTAEGFSFAVSRAYDLLPELQNRVDSFKAEIERIRRLSDFLSAEELLDRVISEKNYYAYLTATEDGDDKVRRVKFFISKSGEGKRYTVSEFIELIKNAPKAFKTGGGGGEAVKFVTMHASKGLEYPVVIVRNVDKPLNDKSDYARKVLTDRKYGFALKYYDDESLTEEPTSLTRLITDRIKENFISEELRLFYVALTRAKYSLNLLMGESVPTGRLAVCARYADFIPSDMPISKVKTADLCLPPIKKPNGVMFYSTDEQTLSKMQEEFSFSYRFSEDTRLPLKSNVTQAIKNEEDVVYAAKEFDYADDSTDRERGNVAHKIMELYDFEKLPDLKEFSKRLIQKGELTESQVLSVNLDKMSAAIFGEALKEVRGKKLYREQDFIVEIEGDKITELKTDSPVVLQGKIDLLAVDGNDAFVIDYKYSAHSGKILKKRYAKQLELYAYAVKKALNLDVKGKYIISLLTGETVKV